MPPFLGASLPLPLDENLPTASLVDFAQFRHSDSHFEFDQWDPTPLDNTNELADESISSMP